MPTLDADLQLQIDEALSNLRGLDDALQTTVDNFSSSLAAGIEGAVQVGSLDAALQSTVDAFSASLSAAIDAAVAQLAGDAATVEVGADTSSGLTVVQDFVGAVDAEQAQITVDADTTDATAALDELTQATDDVTASSSGAQNAMHGAGVSAGELAGVTALARGEVSGLGESAGLLGEKFVPIAAGALAAGAGIAELTKQGLDAVSAEQRFNTALGDQADAVKKVDVGSLRADLFDLGQQFGSTEAAMQNATAQVFQFAVNSGASTDEARKFADGIAAISARAVAVNPNVGTTADVMERAAIGIGRARTAASLLNVGLSTLEVNTLAAELAQKRGEASATAYDKSVAALQLTVEKFGPSLKQNIADGAENAANKTKAAKAEFENALESFAKPLAAPAIDLLKAALPVAEDFGKALADVASVAIPLLTGALQILGPLIEPIIVGFATFKAFELGQALFDQLLLLAGGWGLLGDEAATAAAEVKAASIEIEADETVATGGLSLVAAALAAGAVALFGFGDSAETGAKQLKDFSTAVTDANGTINDTATKAARSLLEERNQIDDLVKAGIKLPDVLTTTSTASKGTATELGHLADVTKELASAQAQVPVGVNATQAAIAANKQTVADLRGEQEKLISQIRQGNPELAQQITLLLDTQKGNAGIITTLQELVVQYGAAKGKAKELGDAQATNAQIQANQNTLTDAANTALQGYQTGTVDATTALKALTDSQKEENDALTLYKNQLLAVQGIQGDITSATIALKNAQEQGFQTLVKNGATFDINTQAGRDNTAALQQQVSAADALAEATFKQTGKQADADKVLTEFTQHLEDNLTALLGSKDGADGVIRSLGLVPPAVDPAAQTLQDLANASQDAGFQALIAEGAIANAAKAVGDFAAQGDGAKAAGDAAAAVFGGIVRDAPPAADVLGDLAAAFGGADGAAKLAALGTAQSTSDIATTTDEATQQAIGSMSVFADTLPTKATEAGTKSSEGFKTGVAPIPDHAGQAVTDAGPKMTGAAADLVGQSGAAFVAGLDVGQAFDAGIELGIGLGTIDIANVAVAAVHAAETAARQAAKAKSPSQLFAELGRDLSLGIAQGLESEQATVAAAAGAVVGAAAGAAGRSVLALPPFVAPAASAGSGGSQSAAGAASAGGALIGQVVNNFHVPVPDPFKVAQQTAESTRHAMFLSGF